MEIARVTVRLSLDTDIIMLLEVGKKLRVQRIDTVPGFNLTRTAVPAARSEVQYSPASALGVGFNRWMQQIDKTFN
jgi:hypothetical protein